MIRRRIRSVCGVDSGTLNRSCRAARPLDGGFPISHPTLKTVSRTLAATLIASITAACSSSGTTSGSTNSSAPPAATAQPGTLTAAYTPEPFTDAMVREEPWTFAQAEGRIFNTPHYRIHTTVDEPIMLDRVPRFVEAALLRYTSALGDLPMPNRQMTVFLMDNRRQWEAKTREVLPREADLLTSIGRGGFATNGMTLLYDLDWGGRTRDTFAITAHEGWHQYTQTVFRNRLPVWLEEGIATWMEGHRMSGDDDPEFLPYRNSERWRTLRRAMYRRDWMIPLDELLSRSPQEFLTDSKYRLLVYYAQVWALAHFIIDGNDGEYRDGLERLLQDAAHGRLRETVANTPEVRAQLGGRRRAMSSRSGPWLIYAYFTNDLDEFEASYQEFMVDLVRRRDLRR